MHSLLIVDDEPLVQIGLASMMDWAALDVTLIGTAANGQKAFELIEEKAPEIAIVDLRMPIMDGMELIERCADRQMEFIILTSSEDFHYAQRAIRRGVTDYLIKLELTPENLTAAIRKAVLRLEARRTESVGGTAANASQSDGSALNAPATGEAPFADVMLVRLLERGFADAATAREAAEALGLTAVAEDAGDDGAVSADDGFIAAAFLLSFPQDRDLSAEESRRLYRCTMDLVKEVFSREARVFMVPLAPRSFAAVLVFDQAPEGRAPEGRAPEGRAPEGRTLLAAGKVREMAGKYFNVDIAVGLGNRYRRLTAIADSHDEAKRAAEIALRENRIVEFRHLHGGSLAPTPRPIVDGRAVLARALDERSPEAVRTAFDTILRLVRGEVAHFPKAMDLCCQVHRQLLDWIDNDESFLDGFFHTESDGCKSLYRARTSDQLAVWLETLRDGLVIDLAARHDSRSHRVVLVIKRHLEDHYAGRTTLASTAERFRISPNYLSSIFKQAEGIGFSEYLSELRIAKAKKLMRESGWKIYEIASAVGFEDAYYFSKVFKRISGLSPSEYVARLQTGE